MSDEYLLRDEKGNPLTSVFHKPPIKTWVPKSMRDIVEVFDKVFPPIKKFRPDDIDEEVKEK